MPIYEFRCKKCKHRFDKLCSLNFDIEDIICPECETSSPERIMSAFGTKGISNAGNSGCTTCKASNCKSCGQ